MSESIETIIKYSSYTPAQKRATMKYRTNNKDKVNEQRKKYYVARKEKDPAFLEYKRMKAKEYYAKKKASKSDVKPDEGLKVIIEEVKVGDAKEEVVSIVVPEVPEVKKRTKKVKPVIEEVKPEVSPVVIPDPEVPFVEVKTKKERSKKVKA